MVATMDYEPDTKGNESYILCADCGTVISSANGAGLCKQLHITKMVVLELTHRCRMFEKYSRYYRGNPK
jgi:RecJ-like exonuclease